MAHSIQRMISALSRLPGIGKKTATRLGYALLSMDESAAIDLAESILEARRTIHPCPVCGDYTDVDPCDICQNPQRREGGVVCVVRDPRDVQAMERMREYKGTYHVLHGLISPMDGIGPSDIGCDRLLERVRQGTIREVILALSSTLEGETTAAYIAKQLEPLGIAITRIAHGVAVGGDLEYTDELTLRKAMENRHRM